tara:strand:- start:597 stop:869 length:273 start_codon:yes stop_codon:yes gene_type:complete
MSIFKDLEADKFDSFTQDDMWIYEPVDHPSYYGGKDNTYEAINVIEAWDLDFHCGNVVKYIARHKEKNNPKQDIEKAIWYLQRYLKTLGD